jgi:hypothetical protein
MLINFIIFVRFNFLLNFFKFLDHLIHFRFISINCLNLNLFNLIIKFNY